VGHGVTRGLREGGKVVGDERLHCKPAIWLYQITSPAGTFVSCPPSPSICCPGGESQGGLHGVVGEAGKGWDRGITGPEARSMVAGIAGYLSRSPQWFVSGHFTFCLVE